MDAMPNSNMTPEEGNSAWNDVTTGAIDTSGDTMMKQQGPSPGVDVETMNPQDGDDYQQVVDIGSSVPAHGEAVASMDAAKGDLSQSKAVGMSGSETMNPSPYGEMET